MRADLGATLAGPSRRRRHHALLVLAPDAPRRHALGFTDHDRDLAFDGTTFEAATGFTATEINDAVGFGVDNLEVDRRARVRPAQRGRPRRRPLRRRRVEIFRVNWPAPTQRVLMRAGSSARCRAPAPPSPPRCAASRTTCSSPRAASSSTAAMPTSAMPAAASTSTIRPSAAPARSTGGVGRAPLHRYRPRRLRRRAGSRAACSPCTSGANAGPRSR